MILYEIQFETMADADAAMEALSEAEANGEIQNAFNVTVVENEE